MTLRRIYIGLGSNLDQPLQQLQQAWSQLQDCPLFQDLAGSGIYRSKAIGPGEQDDYLNAVVSLNSAAEPIDILRALQAMEHRQHRVRVQHWGPRTLDLDLLLIEGLAVQEPDLEVPHPRLCQRNFALTPLLDLNPQATLPDGRRLAALDAAHDTDGLCPTPWKLQAS